MRGGYAAALGKYAKNIRDKCDSFRADKSPLSVIRTDISDRCAEFASEKRGICRLIVPTGGGKTISSVRFAADYCGNFKKKKSYMLRRSCLYLNRTAEK